MMTAAIRPKWNRVEGQKGFDTDAILPFRERLVVCYIHEGRKGIGEAYVDNGIWYWWNTDANIKLQVQEGYRIILWALFSKNMEMLNV